MKFYRLNAQDVMGIINRCYLEANHGRVSLCLDRLGELGVDFPDNARIAYAKGQISRDYLGDAKTARECFARARKLAAAQRLKTETEWFAICNLVQLSLSVEEYQRWADLAFKKMGMNQPECRHYNQVLETLKSGETMFSFLIGAGMEAMNSGHPGLGAALVEAARDSDANIARNVELDLLKNRCNCLRQLDAESSNRREAVGERFPPEERLALHRALEELDRALGMDKYDATLWNYRSAWCHLLERYRESIDAADEAIRLRPHRYPRPYINKAQSLWALERDQEALECAKEGLRQTKGSDLPPDTVMQSQALIEKYSAGRTKPGFEEIKSMVWLIVKSAIDASKEEFAQLQPGRVTLPKVENRILNHLATVPDNPFKGYVPMIAEALASFTPESVALVTQRLLERNRSVPEYCIVAAMYVAVHAEGIHRKDAARYLCLITLLLGDPEAIKHYYRQAFHVISGTAANIMRDLEGIVQEEFSRLSAIFPPLFADQAPISEHERHEAIVNVLEHLNGPPPRVGTDAPVGAGCTVPMLILILICAGIAIL